MKKIIDIFAKVFQKELEVNRILIAPNIWAFGFKNQSRINKPYFYTKYKVLKEGTLKEMSLYFDKTDKFNDLTWKGWILICKEKSLDF